MRFVNFIYDLFLIVLICTVLWMAYRYGRKKQKERQLRKERQQRRKRGDK